MSTLADPTIVELASQGALEITVEEAEDIEIITAGNGNSAVLEAPPEEALEEEEVAEAEAAPAIHIPPVIRKRRVRGRYRSAGAAYQLELRVDVDGVRPMKRVSGDFFRVAGGTRTYFGSFVVNAPSVTTTPSKVKIEGAGTFTWAAGAPYVKVTIPRGGVSAPAKPATIQFIKPPNTPGASYLCPFASQYFRTVQWEQDSVAGVVPFVSYDTGSLPQPPSSSARVLTVPKAYAEAGIEVQVSGAPNVVPVSEAGLNSTWSDSELHNAMVNHFSLFANVPQWRVWLLVATAHDLGYRGIMFDYTDAFQRQGSAVFYNAIQGLDPARQRAQLRTYVHELGHAFNLLHSWQKDLANPPQPLGDNGGLGDLSWMNYVQNYQPSNGPGGEAAYWAAFPFQFTDNELVHLRHGFYKNVIMGANAFSIGAAEIDPGQFDDPIVDNSGLALELRAKEAFELGEPVVIELKLSTTDIRGVETHGYLHPKDDFVTIAIRQPSGRDGDLPADPAPLRRREQNGPAWRGTTGDLRQRVHRLRPRRLLLRAARPVFATCVLHCERWVARGLAGAEAAGAAGRLARGRRGSRAPQRRPAGQAVHAARLGCGIARRRAGGAQDGHRAARRPSAGGLRQARRGRQRTARLQGPVCGRRAGDPRRRAGEEHRAAPAG